jgi:hypothetical protein
MERPGNGIGICILVNYKKTVSRAVDHMQNKSSGINKLYIISVSFFTFILPAMGFLAEQYMMRTEITFALFGKWFIFSAVGLRLFLAGIKQTTNPAFTAKEIFHIDGTESFPILRELGFANSCFGLVGIVSLFKPEWRIVSAFASGIYYGIAGVQHAFKKTSGVNEKFALVTDFMIFAVLLFYFVKMM